MMPSVPSDMKRTIRLGSISVSRIFFQRDMSTLVISASAVCRTRFFGFVVRPSIWLRSVGRSGAITSMTFSLSASVAPRFEALRTAASAHLAFRPCVRASSRSEAAASLIDLAPQVAGDVLAADVDRRRRADVRLRRHGEDVRRLADPDAGRGGAGAGRRDVDDHRHFRGELGLDDLLHRGAEPAGRIEQDHDRVVMLAVRAIDLAVDVVLRDRVDVVLELDRKDTRGRRRS